MTKNFSTLVIVFLELLSFSRTGLTDEATVVKAIRDRGGFVTDRGRPGKPTLKVGFNSSVTDPKLHELTELKSLRELSLFGAHFTDASLKDLNKLKSLQSLTLFGNNFTDDGMKELKELKGLRRLYLSATKVTDAGEKELKAVLPSINIINNK